MQSAAYLGLVLSLIFLGIVLLLAFAEPDLSPRSKGKSVRLKDRR